MNGRRSKWAGRKRMATELDGDGAGGEGVRCLDG